jgi:hypothetical protein
LPARQTVTTDQLDRLQLHRPGCSNEPSRPMWATRLSENRVHVTSHVICHGIPDKPLKDGDIINIDVAVIRDGWFETPAACWASPAHWRSSWCAPVWAGILQVRQTPRWVSSGPCHPGRSTRRLQRGAAATSISKGLPRRARVLRPVARCAAGARHGVHHQTDDQRKQETRAGTAGPW